MNRVAKDYLLNTSTITATLLPAPNGQPVAEKGYGGAEQVTAAPTKPVELPEWAKAPLEEIKAPANYVAVSDSMLANGIRLIVRTDTASPTVTVVGEVKHDSDLQTPAGEEGLGSVLNDLYSYGTQTLDRLAFQKALDDIAAEENAGFEFSLNVLKEYFSRGVEAAGRERAAPGAARRGVHGYAAADRAICRPPAAQSRLSHIARAGLSASSRGRSYAAGSYAGDGLEAHA